MPEAVIEKRMTYAYPDRETQRLSYSGTTGQLWAARPSFAEASASGITLTFSELGEYDLADAQKILMGLSQTGTISRGSFAKYID
jgi:hypothetical protein